MFYLVGMGLLIIVCGSIFAVGRAMQKAPTPSDRETGGSLVAASFVILLLFGLVFSVVRSGHSVAAGHVGVVYQFGNIVDQTEAGFVITRPWQNLREANVQVQKTTFEQLDSFSVETQDVFIGATINYQVNPKDIQDLYRNVGPDYFDKLVPNRVNQFFKDETVKYAAVQIAPNREQIRTNVAQRLKQELSPFSIQIDDLLIDNIRFSEAFTKSIEAKQIATQDAQTARNRVAEAEAKADQIVKEAEGAAQAQRLQRQSLTPLLVQKAMIDKLNPNVQVILLPSDSNFLLPGALLQGAGK